MGNSFANHPSIDYDLLLKSNNLTVIAKLLIYNSKITIILWDYIN